MRAPRFFQASFLLLAFLALPLTAQAQDQAARASNFIQKLGDEAVGVLANKSLPANQAQARFRNMLHNSFDLNLLGRFALGANTWKGLSAQQQAEYSKLFEQLVVEIYSDRFRTYNGEVFKAGAGRAENGTDTYVTSTIVKPDGGQPTQVDWRVREKGGSFKVIDVIVEGVSMSVTKRSEFAAAIQQQGGDFNAFLELLRQKVNSNTPE